MTFDCFTFFNELDLLELRLSELDHVVDKFVIVEAPVTFSGKPKPLHFSDNRQRFSEWLPKIIHVVVNDMPEGSDAWSRERHQRNAIMRGLVDAKPDDPVMISDLDEIPHPESIRLWKPDMGVCVFNQVLSYYWLNCVTSMKSHGTRILTMSMLQNLGGPELARGAGGTVLTPGGWHFSYMGGAERIASKIEAYSHQELNTDEFRDPAHIGRSIRLGTDLFGRDQSFRFVPVDGRFPKIVTRNRSRWSTWIRHPEFHEDWISDDELQHLRRAAESVRPLSGAIIELGSWEGKSTVVIANAVQPQTLIACDTWEGNLAEGSNHGSVLLAKQRDVFQQFGINIDLLTCGNVEIVKGDCHSFLESDQSPVKFAFVDASHDYASVAREIKVLFRRIVPGGVLCGDDFSTAHAGRADLQGGVERAVREILPGFRSYGNFWIWRCPRRRGMATGLVEKSYTDLLGAHSDIQELLPVLHSYASECEHVTEMGTRGGTSTTALIAARPGRVVAYDIEEHPGVVDRLTRLAQDAGVDFKFHQADTLKVDIDPTDLLFIDTRHNRVQLAQELVLHAPNVRKYLVFHDTVTFGERGEDAGNAGLLPAIIDFLRCNHEWVLVDQRIVSNGLTVLGRIE